MSKFLTEIGAPSDQASRSRALIPPAFKPLLPFLKSTIGVQPDRQATRSGTLEALAFEEELEWRHSPTSLTHTWKFGYSREIVANEHHQESLGNRLMLSHDDIESVYVLTQAEADALMAEFPTLTMKIKRWPH